MATTQEERHTVDTPLSKEEYLEKTGTPLPGFTRTLDANDVSVGTTVNGADGGVTVADAGAPGQVFETWQLPDPQKAIDAGLPPVQVPEHLIVDGEHADGKHPQGADGLDLINRDLRQHLGDPRLDGAGRVVADEVPGFTQDDYDEADEEAERERETDETGSGREVGEGNQSSRQRSEQGDTPAGGSPEGQGTPDNTDDAGGSEAGAKKTATKAKEKDKS